MNLQSCEHNFEDATVAFAIDVSGSTKGHILEAEKRFVKDVCSTLSSSARSAGRVLPWDSKARTVLPVESIDSLVAGTGTKPAVTLLDERHRHVLQRSSIWFLITDGMIASTDREKFAKLIPKYNMHGTTCVTVVCGSTYWHKPSRYDISVGVSVFAVAPNCIFLFHDITTNEILILAAKGVFRSLLGDREHPRIDESTTWDSFPRLRHEQFVGLRVPAPQALATDEIGFQNGLVVGLSDLWEGRVEPEKVSEILANEDNITSLVMTSQTRGQVAEFQRWLHKQEIHLDDPLHKPRIDRLDAAANIFSEAIKELRAGRVPSNETQLQLRTAYAANLRDFSAQIEHKKTESSTRSAVVQSSSARASSRIHSASSLTPTPLYSAAPSDVCPPAPHRANAERYNRRDSSSSYQFSSYSPQELRSSIRSSDRPSYPHSSPPMKPFVSSAAPSVSTRYIPTSPASISVTNSLESMQFNRSGLLYTPGFKTATSHGYRGECSICGSSNSVLSWLFQESPTKDTTTMTPNFPQPSSYAKLNFPLAMGNFPEVDVVLPIMCCEACSWFCVKQKTSPSMEHDSKIIAALPIVGFTENKEAYLDVIARVTEGRFTRDHLPQLFMAMLLNTSDALQHQPLQIAPISQLWKPKQFASATNWVCNDLLHSTVELGELSASFSQAHSQYMPLGQVLEQQMKDAPFGVDSSFIRYPLEAFPILIHLATLEDAVSKDVLERVVMRRLLYALVETYVSMGMEAVSGLNGSKSPMIGTIYPNSVLNNVLWKNKEDREAQFCISIKTIREASILDEDTHMIFSRVDVFRMLEESPYEWVGAIMAIFLHTLSIIVEGGSPAVELAFEDPWSLFSKVINHPELGVITNSPESVTIEEANRVIHKILDDV